MQFGLVFSIFLISHSKITHVPGIYLYLPINAFILTTIVFLSLLSLCLHSHQCLSVPKTIHLLKINDGKQKEKPSILHFIIWCDLFIWWYALAGNPKYFVSISPQIGVIYMVSSIFVIPMLVTIGTYFSFHKLVFTYLHFKTRRKFYMKRINMLWISDLASRIRTNINMLLLWQCYLQLLSQ